jgi:diacylglycerol kinase (ATP)
MPQARRRVTLFHNRSAGDGDHDAREQTRPIETVGYEVSYFDAEKCDIACVLDNPGDLIAVAGGDGTVRKVALAARSDGPPIAILPLGTANNIANSLSLTASIGDLIAGWRQPRLRKFHPIELAAPWGRRRLVEGVGLGVLAQIIEECTGRDIAPLDVRRHVAEATLQAEPEPFDIRIDDALIREAVVLLEVTTVPLVGPNLLLAPEADPGDQLIDICWVTAQDQRGVAEWLAAPSSDTAAPLTTHRGSHIAISGRFNRIRLDDSVHSGAEAAMVSVASASEPLYFVVPEEDSPRC